jgi:hypothetical protein
MECEVVEAQGFGGLFHRILIHLHVRAFVGYRGWSSALVGLSRVAVRVDFTSSPRRRIASRGSSFYPRSVGSAHRPLHYR